MKRNKLLFNLFILLLLVIGFSDSTAQELKHSYTFEDGTYDADSVYDQAGSLAGAFSGSGTISDGIYTTAASDDYVTFDGVKLALNAYTSITTEVMVRAGDAQNDSWTMLTYFGGENGSNTYWTAIARGNDYATTSYEGGANVNTDELEDGELHHIVSVLTGTSISFYIDGQLIGTESQSKSISEIATDYAGLCWGAWGNPAWLGSVYEFNIYEGEMDAETVSAHASAFLGEDYTNAFLQTLSSDIGEWDPEFDPSTIEDDGYYLMVPYGTKNVQLTVEAQVSQATVEICEAKTGVAYEDGYIDFAGADGADVEIKVLALDGQTDAYYYVYIYYDPISESAELSDITLSSGYITPEFDSKDTAYYAIVPYGTTSVELTGVAVNDDATVEGGGTITLTNDSAFVTLLVTSEDESNTKTYTVSVHASDFTTDMYYYIQHEDGGLVMGESEASYNVAKLYTPLINDSTQLYQFVESGEEGQYYIQNKFGHYLTLSDVSVSTWDMMMRDDLTQDLDSCRYKVDEFEPGRFRVISVAREAASDEQIYMGTNVSTEEGWVYSDKYVDNDLAIWNLRIPADLVGLYDTYLKGISVSVGSISPSIDPETFDYYVTVPKGTESIEITATPSDPTSEVSGGGVVSLSADTGTIVLTVTATDPSYQQKYYVHYIKDVDLTLKHSYTFANGTAMDMEGDADGTVYGGSITNGMYTASELGDYIDLPGDKIGINKYPSVTLEFYISDDAETVNDDSDTMIGGFGETSGTYGANYLMVSAKSRTAISCLNTSDPYNTESGVDGISLDDDGMSHHIVSVICSDSISLYLDGNYQGATELSDDNHISNLSNDLAYLCRSTYANDNTWLGSISEFNIYAGVMDAQTVLNNSQKTTVETSASDATIDSIVIADTTYTAFSSAVLNYTITLPEGVTEVPDLVVATSVEGAIVETVKATSVPGITTITVTSLDENYQVVYTFEFEGATAVSTPDVATVSVYPTVSNGSFTVESESALQVVSVYNLSGSMVKQYVAQSTRQEITLDKAGMYILVVDADNSRNVFKVIKTN